MPTHPNYPHQLHLDIMVDDVARAEAEVLALGARALPGPKPTSHVYADPAGHPFCPIPHLAGRGDGDAPGRLRVYAAMHDPGSAMRPTTVAAGVLLIALPLAFNAAFALLAARFGYPDILRRPTEEVLDRFRTGGSALVLLWWAFAMSAVLFAPLAVLLSGALEGAGPTLRGLAATVGVLAAAVQFLGLVRWPFLVPYLARAAAEPDATDAQKDAVDIVFQAFNRYLGVAVGEHLGYLLTGVWSVLVGVAILPDTVIPAWLGVVGIVVGAVLAVCSLEFVGPFEPDGWRLAGTVTPIAYIAWSLWLIVTGIALLL